MADKAEMMAEAYRRGLLPPDKEAAYEEAMRRGIVPDAGGKYGRRDAVNDRVRAINQGALLGWGDEVQAFMAAGEQRGRNLSNRLMGRPITRTSKQAYDETLKKERGAQNAFASERPVQSAGLNILGGFMMPGAGPAAGYVGGARSLGGATLRAAGVGGGVGAVAGAGGAEEGKRASGAATGAALGAAVGGALPSVARVAQTAGRAINAATGYRLAGGVHGAATGRLRAALEADGVDEQTIRQTIAEWNHTGAMPPSLADVAGENTRALLRTAGSRPGAARTAAQSYRNETVEAVPDASITRARELTPNEPRPAHVVRQGLEESRDAAARVDYAEPYSQTQNITPELRSALTGRDGAAAIARALRAAEARRDLPMIEELRRLQAVVRNGLDGQTPVNPYYTAATSRPAPPPVSGAALDRIQIALGKTARGLERNDASDIASGLYGRQGAINRELDSFEALGPARAAYRANSEAIEAVDIGQRVLNDPPDVFAASFNAKNPQALEAAKVGARQAITDALGQRANASPVLRQIAFAPNARRNLVKLFGEDEANRFIQAARYNIQKGENANFIAPNTGSQTQNKQQDASIATNMLNAFRRPVQSALERLASGLTLTDEEAAVLIRMGIDPANPALARQPNRLFDGARATGGRAVVAAPNALAQ